MSQLLAAPAYAASPTVTINQAPAQSDPTASAPINFAVTFSEPVSGFDAADIGFTGSTAGGILVATVTGSAAAYTVSVTGMTTEGAVVAGIAAGVATNGGGEPNEASTSTDNSVSWTPDGTAPTVIIDQVASQTDPASTTPIAYAVTFSEPVTGFDAADIGFTGSTAGGTLAAAVTGSAAAYTVKVTGMTTEGTVVASIGAGAATDAAGNPSTASTSTDNTVDWTPVAPTVTIDQEPDQTDPTSLTAIAFAVTFSEPVIGFDAADISFAGSTVGGTLVANVAGSGAAYTVNVTGMTTDGTVTAAIPAGAAKSAAGLDSTASTSTDNTVAWSPVVPPSPSPTPTDSVPTAGATTSGSGGSMPVTGASLRLIIGGALLLLLVGLGFVYVLRRRSLLEG
ncbi:Ig-like domain-containing protein [Hamadaea sp. NPDC051192]|uniref:Ig-like domain-containing protein n=1 Tax=Hamadaea sp. NPDC051192 TaxID=3154940 RepID=UPI003443EF44